VKFSHTINKSLQKPCGRVLWMLLWIIPFLIKEPPKKYLDVPQANDKLEMLPQFS